MVMLVEIVLAGLVGCGHDPEIILTTRLPIDARPGDNDRVMYAMCDLARPGTNDALRVGWVNDRGVVFERTVRCKMVRRNCQPKHER